MNAALWQVGWGYLPHQHGRLRRHRPDPRPSLDLGARSLRRLRPQRRALPALRCGRQPYGLLPVTSLDLWQPPAGQETHSRRTCWLQAACCSRCATTSGGRAWVDAFRLGQAADPPIPTPISPTSCAPTRCRAATARAACSAATTCSICARSSARTCSGRLRQHSGRIGGRSSAAARHSVAAAAARTVRGRDWHGRSPRRWSSRARCRHGKSWSRITSPRCWPRRHIDAADQRPARPGAPDGTTACCRRCCATRCCARSRTPRRRSPPANPAPTSRCAAARRRAGGPGHRRAADD